MDDLVKRLRFGIHTSVDPLALTNEVADHIEKLEAEVNRLVKSRNKWGKLYNQTLEKLRLSVMSDSEYVKIIDAKNVEQADRIEQLKAALREIGHINNKRDRFSSQIDEILCNIFWTEKDGTKIEKGWLSNRAYNALMSEGVNTIEKIEEAGSRHLLRFPNFGHKTLKEVKEFLACRGISLLEYGKNKWE